LEDLSAHSNWIELALIELGYTQVFAHVGSNTQISLPNGKRVWPMVTGTFGGVDFIHSLLGELGDHISQTSVTDLNAAITEAEHQNSQELYDKLKTLLSLVPSGQSDLEGIQVNGQALGGSAGGSAGFHLQGQQGEGVAVSAEEIFKQIYPIFALKDKITKTIITMIDKVRIPLEMVLM
jgi:Heterokaryon incompatibility protein Het-C